jgi:recombination protein RecA
MSSAATIRLQIESALARKIPSALTPAPCIVRPVAGVGIASVDELLDGGLPLGAITEMVGPECSGRTSFAMSFLSQMTQTGKVCAWIDVSNTLHPESAAMAGVDLARLLWVRCGVPASTNAQQSSQNVFALHPLRHPREHRRLVVPSKPWSRIEQALRVTDLLLQAGGFSAIVLDMGSLAPEHASRVPLATWFRYRAAAERTQASILLLTQHPCAKSSAGLVLRLQPGQALQEETTVFTGLRHHVEVSRQRFLQAPSNVISLRKPPQRNNTASWQTRTTWAGCR